METLKETVAREIKDQLETKILQMQQRLTDIRNDTEKSGKSSMGDKYETTREMLKQEEEKVARQLELTAKQLNTLSRVRYNITPATVESGTLVKAGRYYFFILTAVGIIKAADKEVFVVSPVSPVARNLLGLKKGEKFLFNREQVEVEEIR